MDEEIYQFIHPTDSRYDHEGTSLDNALALKRLCFQNSGVIGTVVCPDGVEYEDTTE